MLQPYKNPKPRGHMGVPAQSESATPESKEARRSYLLPCRSGNAGTRTLHPGILVALAFLGGLFLWLTPGFSGQPFGAKGIPAKGFKIAEPHDPPHESQTKSLLEGGKALVLPGGSAVLSEGVVLRTYSETNTAQLVVRARECFYNATNRSVNSAGPIQMQTADGSFTIEGMGFLWQQTNSSLLISNDVHTTIQGNLLQSTKTNGPDSLTMEETGPLHISSVQFSYDGPSGRGIWSTNVHVTGTNLALDSEVLTAMVPMKERQVRSLLAEEKVDLDYSGLHATGGRLNYAPDTGLVRLTNQATWETVELKNPGEKQAIPRTSVDPKMRRQGSGDELVIDRTNRIFQVNGNAWLSLPGQALGESGFLTQSNRPAAKSGTPTNSSVQIFCDRYEFRTNWATFHDQVRLDEREDQLVRGHLNCQDMIVTFSGSNELQTMTAVKDVVIQEGTNRFTGGRAFYTHTNTTLEITENPAWQSGLREGKGDLLRLNSQRSELLARGNASLRLPANQLAGQFLPSGATNRAPRSGTNQFADVFCEEYTLRPDKSEFIGGVYATHPEMNWSCEKLTVIVPTAGLTNLIAEQNVVFEIMTQKGKVQGKGDKAVYTFGLFNTITNGNLAINELRLTGLPAVVTNAVPGMASQNNLIIWDRTKNKISLPGSDYRMQGYYKATDTNLFMLPNQKVRK